MVLSHCCALFRVPWGKALYYNWKEKHIHWEYSCTNKYVRRYL